MYELDIPFNSTIKGGIPVSVKFSSAFSFSQISFVPVIDTVGNVFTSIWIESLHIVIPSLTSTQYSVFTDGDTIILLVVSVVDQFTIVFDSSIFRLIVSRLQIVVLSSRILAFTMET